MAETKYGKYIISNPLPYQPSDLPHHSEEQETGTELFKYLSKDILPETTVNCFMARHYDVPKQPSNLAHKHEAADEVLLFIAMNPDGNLGTEVEIEMGDEGEKHTFSRNTVIFIPKGLTHTPIRYKNFDKTRQHYTVALSLEPEYT